MFIYSVPFVFTYLQAGSKFELLLVLLFLLTVLLIATPSILVSRDNINNNPSMTFHSYLLAAWGGQSKLWIIFWPFFILLNFILFVVDSLARQGNFTVSGWDEVHLILLIPTIFWVLVVWRNSFNTSRRLWAAIARVMTLCVFFEYGLKLIIRIDYPRIFFVCNESILDYAGCF